MNKFGKFRLIYVTPDWILVSLVSLVISIRLVLFGLVKIPILISVIFYITQVAIPVIPTIRVLVTFTKFEELEPIEDEFVTPPSTPTSPVKNSPREETQASSSSSSSSWYQWMKTPSQRPSTSSGGFNNGKGENDQDPFAIPRGYNWITAEEKKKKVQEKNKAKKGKSSQNS